MKAQKFLKYLLLLVIAGNLAIVAYVFLGSQPPPSPPLPNPNGYDDIVTAGRMLRGKPWDFDTLNSEQLRILVTTNADALTLLRIGLGRECRIPALTSSNLVSYGFGYHYSLAFALMAEGRLAEMDHRTNDAAGSYLDIIRLSHECARGGMILDSLSGGAIEVTGVRTLLKIPNSLDAKLCAMIAKNLESIDAKSDPWLSFLAGEKKYKRSRHLKDQLYLILHYQEIKQTEQKAETAYYKRVNQRRQAIITFAARAYTLDKGTPPKSITDLVPAYLEAIPQDAFTGTNLVYSP